MMGRAVERCLLDGRISIHGEASLEKNAMRLRKSLDEAYTGSDWRFMDKLLSGVFRGVKGIRFFGSRVVRQLYKGRIEPAHLSVEKDMSALPEEERGKVE